MITNSPIIWLLISQFASASKLKLETDKQRQNALNLYLKTASILN